jgi:hypothetical protein
LLVVNNVSEELIFFTFRVEVPTIIKKLKSHEAYS